MRSTALFTRQDFVLKLASHTFISLQDKAAFSETAFCLACLLFTQAFRAQLANSIRQGAFPGTGHYSRNSKEPLTFSSQSWFLRKRAEAFLRAVGWKV